MEKVSESAAVASVHHDLQVRRRRENVVDVNEVGMRAAAHGVCKAQSLCLLRAIGVRKLDRLHRDRDAALFVP